jgi:hypothetical protein
MGVALILHRKHYDRVLTWWVRIPEENVPVKTETACFLSSPEVLYHYFQQSVYMKQLSSPQPQDSRRVRDFYLEEMSQNL